jgi:hypothetical protein
MSTRRVTVMKANASRYNSWLESVIFTTQVSYLQGGRQGIIVRITIISKGRLIRKLPLEVVDQRIHKYVFN